MSIVVVGSCNVDQITVVPQFMKEGETIRGLSYAIGCGGKGANQAVMAGKLGGSVEMVSRVGTDAMGDMFLKNFLDTGVGSKMVQKTEGATTGVATILVNERGQNAIAIIGGANDLISAADVEASSSLISNCDILLTQNEISEIATLTALRIGTRSGKPLVIWNAAPAPTTVNAELLQSCDILCVNETEAETMSGVMVNSVESAGSAAARLRQLGAKKGSGYFFCFEGKARKLSQVLVTLGAGGSVLFDEEGEATTAPSFPVTAVDTTGAGDSYLGALAFFLSKKVSFGEAMKRASIVAAESVKAHGTQTSYPTRTALPASLFDGLQ